MNLEHKCSTAILLVKCLGSLFLIGEVLTTTATSLLNKLVLSEAGVPVLMCRQISLLHPSRRYTHRNYTLQWRRRSSIRETNFSAEEPGESGYQRGEGDGEEHRSPQRECNRRHPYPESPFVEH